MVLQGTPAHLWVSVHLGALVAVASPDAQFCAVSSGYPLGSPGAAFPVLQQDGGEDTGPLCLVSSVLKTSFIYFFRVFFIYFFSFFHSFKWEG